MTKVIPQLDTLNLPKLHDENSRGALTKLAGVQNVKVLF